MGRVSSNLNLSRTGELIMSTILFVDLTTEESTLITAAKAAAVKALEAEDDYLLLQLAPADADVTSEDLRKARMKAVSCRTWAQQRHAEAKPAMKKLGQQIFEGRLPVPW